MKNAALLEIALRALYQSGLLMKPVIHSGQLYGRQHEERKLWLMSMEAAKAALESEPMDDAVVIGDERRRANK